MHTPVHSNPSPRNTTSIPLQESALVHLVFTNDQRNIEYQVYEYAPNIYFDWRSSEGPQGWGSVGRAAVPRTGIKKGEWHQLAFTWNDERIVAYLNGKKITESFYEYQKLPKSDKLSHLMIQNTVTGCTVMMNRAAADLVSDAPASEMLLMYDHYAAIVVAATGHIGFVDDPLIRYRQHSGNQVGAHAAGSKDEYKMRFDMGRDKFLKDMDLSYRQVGFILKRYGDLIKKTKGEEVYEMMREYSNLVMAGKIEKLEFFQKYGVYKNGAIKKMVQMIWC